MRPLRVFTWHIHGNYLYYLSQALAEFYLPVKPGGREGYGGRGCTFPFGDNVHEVPAEAVRDLRLDCVLFQAAAHYAEDQYTLLSADTKTLYDSSEALLAKMRQLPGLSDVSTDLLMRNPTVRGGRKMTGGSIGSRSIVMRRSRAGSG